MRNLRWALAAVAASFVASTGARAAPLDAYGALPSIEDIALSPDGKKLAVIVTNGETRKILVREIDSKKNLFILDGGAQKVRGITFAGPNSLLITTSTSGNIADVFGPKHERFITVNLDLATGRQSALIKQVETQSLNTTIGTPMVRVINGAPTVFIKGIVFNDDGHGVLALFRTKPGDSRAAVIASGTDETDDHFVDEQGNPIARTQYNQKSGAWQVQIRRPSNWQTAASGEDPTGSPDMVGFGRTPGTILVRFDDAESGPVLRELNIADGKLGEPLPKAQFSGVVRDRTEHLLAGQVVNGDERHLTFVDPSDQARWRSITSAYKGDIVEFSDLSDDHQRVIVRVDSLEEGPAYAIVDLTAKHSDWLGNVYESIKAGDISPVKAISYKAADGMDIPAYLSLPKGKSKALALVVLPHGGPASRDALGFDWWAQALAAQGYAVLQPNFRGSTGYGREFLRAGYGEFGKKMQTDLSDGVRFLAADGTIDPKRVCIVGASYGGYAALAGATLDTGVYRCAASVAGPADLQRMLKVESRDHGDATLRYWVNFMGVDGMRDPDLLAISPAAHADKVTIPLLLVHGKDDTVVLYEQSRLMAEAMRKAGKPVDFVTLEGEDHWLSRGKTRQEMLKAVVEFLKKNNPPE